MSPKMSPKMIRISNTPRPAPAGAQATRPQVGIQDRYIYHPADIRVAASPKVRLKSRACGGTTPTNISLPVYDTHQYQPAGV